MSTGAGVVHRFQIWDLNADNLYAGHFPGLRALRTLKPVLHSPRESFGSNLQRNCDVVTMNPVAFVEWFVGK